MSITEASLFWVVLLVYGAVIRQSADVCQHGLLHGHHHLRHHGHGAGPVFLFFGFTQWSHWSFHLSLWTGLSLGVLLASGMVPPLSSCHCLPAPLPLPP